MNDFAWGAMISIVFTIGVLVAFLFDLYFKYLKFRSKEMQSERRKQYDFRLWIEREEYRKSLLLELLEETGLSIPDTMLEVEEKVHKFSEKQVEIEGGADYSIFLEMEFRNQVLAGLLQEQTTIIGEHALSALEVQVAKWEEARKKS